MLFLTDVDHVSFEKANETRKNNLQSATVSLQVVIDLCKRKERGCRISKYFCWAAALLSAQNGIEISYGSDAIL